VSHGHILIVLVLHDLGSHPRSIALRMSPLTITSNEVIVENLDWYRKKRIYWMGSKHFSTNNYSHLGMTH